MELGCESIIVVYVFFIQFSFAETDDSQDSMRREGTLIPVCHYQLT